MNRRHQLLIGAVGVLLGLNVWHWWPKAPRSQLMPGYASMGKTLRVEDFVIQGVPEGKLSTTARNLFQPKRPVVIKPPAPVKPPEPPPKSPEELEREAAQAEFNQIRCLALVFREGRGLALMSVNRQDYHVSAGEWVGSRFVVTKVEADGVFIQDSKTGIGGKISLSGTNQ